MHGRASQHSVQAPPGLLKAQALQAGQPSLDVAQPLLDGRKPGLNFLAAIREGGAQQPVEHRIALLVRPRPPLS